MDIVKVSDELVRYILREYKHKKGIGWKVAAITNNRPKWLKTEHFKAVWSFPNLIYEFLRAFITVDETWTHYTSQTKQQSK